MSKTTPRTFKFVNSFTSALLPDPDTPGTPLKLSPPAPRSQIPHPVKSAHFSYVQPEHTPDPTLISVSKPAAALVDLDIDTILDSDVLKKQFLSFVCGNEISDTTNPWAMCYGGHQFGSWAGQLGDGRAITLGEVQNDAGDRWELQLKGAGLTPYSRFADGYAVLRSSIREYLASEAMFHLGIPTTRALSLIGSTRPVMRETEETAAIVLRMAPSWVRFGNFEIFYARGDVHNLRKLADYVINTHFPEIAKEEKKYSAWIQEVTNRTAKMIAGWQGVGFCHGVMNTDNFSILGLTLDYGPFQFMDAYDPNYICNHSDHGGRYAFNAQPGIGLWNCTRLASATSALVVEEEGGNKERAEERLVSVLNTYGPTLKDEYSRLMRLKLGLQTEKDDDLDTLVYPLLGKLADASIDHTKFFRNLSTNFRLADPSNRPNESDLQDWYAKYVARLTSELGDPASNLEEADKQRQERMKKANPKYVLRNHLAQEVIDEAEKGNFGPVNEFLEVLQRPFEEGTVEEERRWAGNVPGWARGLKCSCSS
ncbi:hypothetical protein HDV00_011885 [Rhizophlyctis rosea]|nr:hypothetical protein HDV00_011885 [Rhizophlyctis rosea]